METIIQSSSAKSHHGNNSADEQKQLANLPPSLERNPLSAPEKPPRNHLDNLRKASLPKAEFKKSIQLLKPRPTLLFKLMFSIICLLAPFTSSAFIKDPVKCASWPCLIFSDDFTSLDHSIWEHMKTCAATGNKEFQYYTNNRTNSFIKDGVLFIKPTLTNETYDDEFLISGTLDLWGSTPHTQCTSNRESGCYREGSKNSIISPVQSAALRSVNSFSFKYGKVEVRAKMPKGDWIWPAVWLMPKYSVYGEWPASGEIDLIESRGNGNLQFQDNKVGNQMVQQSLHWGPYYPYDGRLRTSIRKNLEEGKSFGDEFHKFTMDWSSEYLAFSIDDEVTLNVTVDDRGFWGLGGFDNSTIEFQNPWTSGTRMAPFDEEFYLIMNVAVGGTNHYFSNDFKPPPPWSNDSPGGKAMKEFWDAREQWLPTWNRDETAMKIDYVKIWVT